MKFCTKCGNKLSDSMKFCNKCGAKVKSVDKDTETNSDTEDTKDKKDIPNSKNNIDKTIPVIQPIPNFNKNIIASFLLTSVFFVDVKAFNELINLL